MPHNSVFLFAPSTATLIFQLATWNRFRCTYLGWAHRSSLRQAPTCIPRSFCSFLFHVNSCDFEIFLSRLDNVLLQNISDNESGAERLALAIVLLFALDLAIWLT